MARKPNFDFERREREKAKAEKLAAKAKAKSERNPGSDELKAAEDDDAGKPDAETPADKAT